MKTYVDNRKAFAPRLGFAYSPGSDAKTVIRAGIGLYYNDLAQSGWVTAFQAVKLSHRESKIRSCNSQAQFRRI